ncbi:MAG TPA: T9SS type A sorting domain-containing protein, partial [bacterium]
AGVATAEMFYSINGGAEQKVAMTLASGTNTDGTWSAVLPSGYVNPGDVCALRFEATDKPGLMTALNGGSFRYFSKTADVLFYYNDNSFETADAKDYYWNEPKEWLFDTWDGTTDGAAQIALLDMYDYIVRVDGDYPVNLDNDVFKKWLATGTADKKKYLFWSSQDFLGKENGWVNTTYAADDWHNMYLGISAVSHDLQSAATDVFPPVDPWPVDAVLNDPITGALAKFCADSSFQLLHNPWFEIGGHEFSDHVEPGAGAVTCIRDHASGVSMGVWKDGTSTKTVFLGLDQIALDMNPPYIFPPTYPRYVWPEYGYPSYATGLSILEHSLAWFNAPTAVDNNVEPGVITDYSLSQNYPNPFNPETKISFSIAKAGNASLAVYNVVGQKVADLVNGQKAAGKYQITWNANDLGSGVYFYRLEVGDFSRTMKMMLLR